MRSFSGSGIINSFYSGFMAAGITEWVRERVLVPCIWFWQLEGAFTRFSSQTDRSITGS
jgi:hypothetical protein